MPWWSLRAAVKLAGARAPGFEAATSSSPAFVPLAAETLGLQSIFLAYLCRLSERDERASAERVRRDRLSLFQSGKTRHRRQLRCRGSDSPLGLSPMGVHHDCAAASFEALGPDGADAAQSRVTIAVCLLGLSRDEFLQSRRYSHQLGRCLGYYLQLRRTSHDPRLLVSRNLRPRLVHRNRYHRCRSPTSNVEESDASDVRAIRPERPGSRATCAQH